MIPLSLRPDEIMSMLEVEKLESFQEVHFAAISSITKEGINELLEIIASL